MEQFPKFDNKFFIDVKIKMINHPNVKPDLIKAFFKDESPEVRVAAVKSPKCTKEILLEAVNSSFLDIYKEATKRIESGNYLLTAEEIQAIEQREEELKQERTQLEEEEREALDNANPLLRDAVEEVETFDSSPSPEPTSLSRRLKAFFGF